MADKKTRKPRRSASEIIAEQEAKLAARKAKLAMREASEDPRLASLAEALQQAEIELLKTRQGLGDSAQGFASRRKSHLLWIDEIDEQENYARVSEEHQKEVVSFLKKGLASAAQAVSEDNFTEDTVSKILDNAPQEPEEVESTRFHAQIAQDARKAHTENKKSSKSD